MDNIAMDYAVLIGRIKDTFKTHGQFAKSMGISESGLSAKLNNHREFTSGEIRKACELLNIPAEEIPAIFFTQKVAVWQP